LLVDVESYAALARSTSKEVFIEQLGDVMFLLKRAAAGSHTTPHEELPMSYRTTNLRMKAEYVDAHELFGAGIAIWPLQKKPGNPYPDRISVGRAVNCDVVLRAPYLSKLHAHFWRNPDGSLQLSDNSSANGTRLNSTPLIAGEAASVRSGDRISFGGLDLELIDAAALWDLLALE
jgi:hypothetical protein